MVALLPYIIASTCTAVKCFFDIAELRMQNKYALNEGVLDKKVPYGKYGLYVPMPPRGYFI
jgi:hypothetical protein